MRLRSADKEDLSRVMEITKAVVPFMQAAGNTQWSEIYPNMERFEKDCENGSLYIYEDDGLIRGFTVVDDEHPEAYNGIRWEIPRESCAAMHRMAVDPSCQGKGIAGDMIKRVESILVDAGYDGIHTDTSLENEKMQYQFEKNGFAFRGKLHLDENEDDWYVAYEKILKKDK
ncbi:GNAT family N-acetyltransferase [Salinicoccus sp. HZC-1]|uniref:GNAT family N-acetyltransferase n=1 Tax=Salinicoccus sp. HZC-1 TaxID=3385497 RepID=UPI00398B2193